MTVYWLMFVPMALLAVFEQGELRRHRFVTLPALFAASVLTVLVGYRYQVGGDWYNYAGRYDFLRRLDLDQILAYGLDPGYGLLNGFASDMGWGIIGVNVVSGAFFALGLVTFCWAQPRPWLALAVAVPYLVIVVGMGYTRQSVAIGFVMMGLVFLARTQNLLFVMFVLAAAMFHKSAVVLLPIAVLAATEKKLWTALWVGVAFAFGYLAVLQDSVDDLVNTYVSAQMQSQGAMIRVLMNAVPAVLFLWLRPHFHLQAAEKRLWTWLALFSIVSVMIVLVLPSSTAVDRMGLYLIPIQLYVLSRLPDAAAALGFGRGAVSWGVILYSAAIQFVWLNFAAHSYAWVPYKFYFLEVP